MKMPRPSPTLLLFLALALSACALSALAEEPHHDDPVPTGTHFRVNRFANWLFLSFLEDETDDNQTWGMEFETVLSLGKYEMKNISYFEINQYDRGVPGQPPGNPDPPPDPANGMGDIISGFWFSKRTSGEHHDGHHFAPGFALQVPTAAADTLGSGKWAVGPSFDYEYSSGRLFAGAIALQVWSFAGDPDRKDVSMLMIKPFVYYEFAKHWNLVYVPYGITVYWNKPEGEKVYLPLGGGIQRTVPVGSLDLNLSAQYFRNVVRPTNGTVRDLRFLIELSF